MSENLQVVYKNGIFRPLESIELPEDKYFNIDVHEMVEKTDNKTKLEIFNKWMANLDPNTPTLTDEQMSRESIYEDQRKRQL
ncbi:MAG: antitoxin family protein [Pyrinomonadaceae bacterium]|nr:antitoxin family protein [Pyrinomonadaceae bacterium]